MPIEKWERMYVVRFQSDGSIVLVDGMEPQEPLWIVSFDKELGQEGWQLVAVNPVIVEGAHMVEHIYQRKIS